MLPRRPDFSPIENNQGLRLASAPSIQSIPSEPLCYGIMPRTTQCQKCGIFLNLPAHATAGKRLKCPKCGLRFALTETDASSESTVGGHADAHGLSHPEIETQPQKIDDLPISLTDRDLRETFDLPLLSGRDAERGEATTEPAIADAASLLDEPPPKRRKTAAELRLKARRCSCGGYVPQGMSVCMSCGLDQETGLRITMADDLLPPPPPRPLGPPIHVAIVGGLCATAALIFLIMALMGSASPTTQGWQVYGWLCLALVSIFGILASTQFIRGKSAKLLMLALTLGAVVDVMGLVVIPLIEANLEDPQQIIRPNTKRDDPDDPEFTITPFEERIELRHITLGITFLVVYGVLSVYLMSSSVKKYIHSQND